MEPKDIQEGAVLNESPIEVALSEAFDRLEEKDSVFFAIQYNPSKKRESVFPFSRKENIVELREEELEPLENIFIQSGLLPEDSHFSSLKIAVTSKKLAGTSGYQRYSEMIVSIEDSKVSLDSSLFPNMAKKHSNFLVLSFKFGLSRLRAISLNIVDPLKEKNKIIHQTQSIFGEIDINNKSFNEVAFAREENILKREETENIRVFIAKAKRIFEQKKVNKDFTESEIKFINWAIDLLEEKGVI